jgi:hypothetical protein
LRSTRINSKFVGGGQRRNLRARQRARERHLRARQHDVARVVDLPLHHHQLTAIADHVGHDLRRDQEFALHKTPADLAHELPHAQAGRLDVADVREGDHPVGADLELLREPVLTVDLDLERVFRSHLVAVDVGAARQRRGRQRRGLTGRRRRWRLLLLGRGGARYQKERGDDEPKVRSCHG